MAPGSVFSQNSTVEIAAEIRGDLRIDRHLDAVDLGGRVAVEAQRHPGELPGRRGRGCWRWSSGCWWSPPWCWRQDGAPPAGDVGLVGASVHAAVTTHTKPSQARTILIDMVQTAKARGD